MQLTRAAAFSRVLPVARPARGSRVVSPLKASPVDEFGHEKLGWRGPKPPSQEKDQQNEDGAVPLEQVRDSAPSARTPEFGEVMSFNGIGPEIINGRLAMLGITAALASELFTGVGVLQQIQMRPIGILITFLVLIGASLVPFAQGKKVEKVEEAGPLTPTAELINGRTAMIGFVALLATEYIKGGPLLSW